MFPRLSELSATIAKPVAVQEDAQLDEGKRGNMASLIERWMDANKIYSFEGSRGEQRFTKLVSSIGYRSLSEFFEDNPGVMEAMVEWIGSQNSPEWEEKMKDELGPEEGDEDEDDK